MEKLRLKELILPIEQSLKFLYPLCFSLKDKIMLLAGQALQVTWSIIICNSVEMMNHPPLGQWFAIRFLPNYNVFPNVRFFGALRCPRMFRLINVDITETLISTPSPARVFCPSYFGESLSIICNRALSASFCYSRMLPTYFFPAIYTMINSLFHWWHVGSFLPTFNHCTPAAPKGIGVNWTSAIQARVLMLFSIPSLFLSVTYHKYSIPYHWEDVKYA